MRTNEQILKEFDEKFKYFSVNEFGYGVAKVDVNSDNIKQFILKIRQEDKDALVKEIEAQKILESSPEWGLTSRSYNSGLKEAQQIIKN